MNTLRHRSVREVAESALQRAEQFIAEELECREASMLPSDPINGSGDEQYVRDAREALAAVREGLMALVEQPR